MVSSFRSPATLTIKLSYNILFTTMPLPSSGLLPPSQVLRAAAPRIHRSFPTLLGTSALNCFSISFQGSLVPLNLSFHYCNLASASNPSTILSPFVKWNQNSYRLCGKRSNLNGQ